MKLPLTRIRALHLAHATEKGRPPYVAAASGLLRAGQDWLVIPDDELALAAFSALDDAAPGRLITLFPGTLPLDPKARKKAKPDCEGLLAIGDWIVAIPSGSKPNRTQGAAVRTHDYGGGREVSFHKLYGEVLFDGRRNFEGACVRGNEVLMFQRGNSLGGVNAIVALAADGFLDRINDGRSISKKIVRTVTTYELGSLHGVPLGFTDAATLPDGRILFAAAAEATKDAVDDGVITGSVLGTIGRDGKIGAMHELARVLKVEGVHTDGVHVWLVTDGDDLTQPAVLYQTTLPE